MDVLFTAIISALTKLSDMAVKDAYEGLKALIQKKFGKDSQLVEAIQTVESKPESSARQDLLKEELSVFANEYDKAILDAAKMLLEQVRSLPDGKQIVQDIQVKQNIMGDHNFVTGKGDINVNQASRRR